MNPPTRTGLAIGIVVPVVLILLVAVLVAVAVTCIKTKALKQRRSDAEGEYNDAPKQMTEGNQYHSSESEREYEEIPEYENDASSHNVGMEQNEAYGITVTTMETRDL